MFNFPKIEREEDFRYKNNFLNTVVFQVKFNPVVQVVNNIPEIKELLSDFYPNNKNIVKVEGSFNLDQKTPLLQSAKSTTQGIEFRTSSGDNVLSITEDAITLTILGSAYKNFNDAISLFKSFFVEIAKIISIEYVDRVAIRKINIIQASTDETSDKNLLMQAIYNDALINNLNYIPSSQYLDSAIITSKYNNEGFSLNLIYGLLPAQNKIYKQRQFLLDIDLFNESHVELDNVTSIFNEINEEIFNIFNWSFKDEIKTMLNH
jgi:uncharacterized protein (TIGR04255 family)